MRSAFDRRLMMTFISTIDCDERYTKHVREFGLCDQQLLAEKRSKVVPAYLYINKKAALSRQPWLVDKNQSKRL